MALNTSVAGVALGGYVCNASGPRDATLEELEVIANSGSSAIVMKSCTREPREGNEEPRYSRLAFGAIQSMGLPNLGFKAYVGFASQLAGRGKPVVASVAGLSLEDFVLMVGAFQDSAVDLIEVNLSCPNLAGKPPVAYDFSRTAEVLDAVCGLGSKPVGLKLPPYYDFVHHDAACGLIASHRVGFVTCINSIGNALAINPETEAPVIRPKGGFGGLCGDYIKPVALANVRAFFERLAGKVSIFGVGGVKSGSDAFEFLLAGADAVQVATAFENEGPACFGRIASELELILQRKGYSSVDGVKGRLKRV
ncbi:MAG: dihydroorotate oxidase [Candidatus Micrarchaeota archaeon]